MREKWGNFDPLIRVRVFCHVMSGNCQGSCFRLKLPSYNKGSAWDVQCKCLLGKYKLRVYRLLLLSCYLFKNPGYVVELPLITTKCVFNLEK